MSSGCDSRIFYAMVSPSSSFLLFKQPESRATQIAMVGSVCIDASISLASSTRPERAKRSTIHTYGMFVTADTIVDYLLLAGLV